MANLFSETGECEECGGKRDVIKCYLRSGWGRTRTNWNIWKPKELCRSCRGKYQGHWKRAGKKPKPDKRKAKRSEFAPKCSGRTKPAFV